MPQDNRPYDIHVHGDVPLRDDVTFEQIQDALKPVWLYAGAKSLAGAAASSYEDEPGIRFDVHSHTLQMCWTVPGDEDFRQALDDMCMGLNDLTVRGAAIEVGFYDAEFDEEDDEGSGQEARDDFYLLFVGPSPAAIMDIQRDLLVEDVVAVMERHFDGSELKGVVDAIDALFQTRLENLTSTLDVARLIRGPGTSGAPGAAAHGGGRKPRHLH